MRGGIYHDSVPKFLLDHAFASRKRNLLMIDVQFPLCLGGALYSGVWKLISRPTGSNSGPRASTRAPTSRIYSSGLLPIRLNASSISFRGGGRIFSQAFRLPRTPRP